jgi:hypothetical protein
VGFLSLIFHQSGLPVSTAATHRFDPIARQAIALVVANGTHGGNEISFFLDSRTMGFVCVEANTVSAMALEFVCPMMPFKRLRQVFRLAHIKGLVLIATRLVIRSIRDDK